MTADPYKASAGAEDPGSWNRYAYVKGDPVNLYDPRGWADCWTDGQVNDVVKVLCRSEGGWFPTETFYEGVSSTTEDYARILQDAHDTIGRVSDAAAATAGIQVLNCYRDELLSSFVPSSFCREQLAQIQVVTPTGLAPLTWEMMAQTLAGTSFGDGLTSTASIDVISQGSGGTGTVGQYFRGNIGVGFAADWERNRLFFRPNFVLGLANGVGGTGGPRMLYANLLHELIHLTAPFASDTAIQRALGLEVNPNDTSNITNHLFVSCAIRVGPPQ